MTQQYKKLSTSYHQSGRFVMAYLMNEDIEKMDSLLKGKKPVIKHTFKTYNFVENDTKIFFAGTTALQNFYLKCDRQSEDDKRKEIKVLSFTVEGDKPLQQKVDALKKETEKIVSDNWDMVEDLANELFKQNTLTGKQVVTILKQYSKRKE